MNDPSPLMHVDWIRWFQNIANAVSQPLTPGMIPNIPFTKIEMTLSPRLLGRTTAGAGSAEQITVSAPLTLAAGALGITGSALTRVDDTNVTLTLGGSPTTALLAATSLTLGWTGTLAATRGGTGFGSYAVGDSFYASSTTALAKRTIGSAGDVWTVSAGLPVWAAPAAAATSVIVDDTTTNSTMFPTWVTANTGNLPIKVTSTKLSFNPSTGRLTTTGLTAGGSAAPTDVEGYFATTSASDPRGIMSAQYSTDAGAARMQFQKARGTEGTPTIVVTGDLLGRMRFSGYDGSNYIQMAGIDVVVTGTVGALRVPTYMTFWTGTDAAVSTLTERMRIDAAGNVGIGRTPVYKLDIQAVTGDLFARLNSANSGGDTQFIFNNSGSGVNSWAFGRKASTGAFQFFSSNGQYPAGALTIPFTIEATALTNSVYITSSGNVGFGTGSATAVIHIKAGTTSASTAPLKFTSGALNTTAEAGAVEFLTDKFYGTITTGAARKTFAFLESPALVTPDIGAATGASLSLSNTINLIATGAAATAGTATLVAGTVTVNTTAMTATALLFLQRKTSGGTIGFGWTYTQVNGTSFTVTSDSVLDTSTFVWAIVETH